ncbi:hypothetical protein [Streptomyces anulatus]|uniref:hypothetical protein n=1 Tax=Streptomyces anulatus TaxID=1892 RepID=UPI001C260BC5|nr:hypothetical protein [Streptomyces anulatus]
MGQYGITHACGHHETVQLCGKSSQREARARWLEHSDCGSCWKSRRDRQRAEDAERDAAANRTAGLPELQGSPRQITWAETIRASMLHGLTLAREHLTQAAQAADGEEQLSRLEQHLQYTDSAHMAVAAVTSAKWLIDHRDLPARHLIQKAAQGTLRPRTPQQQALGFDPYGLNTLTFPAGDVAADAQDERCIRLRLTHSRWEGCTALLPRSMVQQEPDGTLTARIGGAWTIRIDDGARIGSVPAEQFHQDRTHRRDHPAQRHYWGPPPYEDGTSGEFDVPEADVSERTNDRGEPVAVVRLVCSRWEGLRFEHPLNLLRRHRPGHVTVRFGPHWHFRVLGGRRTLRVPAQQMHEDRTNPLPQPGPSQAVEPKTWYQVAFHPSRVRRGASTWWLPLPPGTPWPHAVIHHREQLVSVQDDGPDHITWRFPANWTFRARTPDGDTITVSAEEFRAAISPWAGTAPAPGTYTRRPPALAPLDEVAVHAELLEDDTHFAPEP